MLYYNNIVINKKDFSAWQKAVRTLPSGSTNNKCRGCPFWTPDSTYCPAFDLLSLTRKSPSSSKRSSASARDIGPWYHTSDSRGVDWASVMEKIPWKRKSLVQPAKPPHFLFLFTKICPEFSCLKKYALDVGPEFSWQNHYIDQNNLNITDCRLVVNERPEFSLF